MPAHAHKYPSTPHLMFSSGLGRGDTKLKTLRHFQGREVVASIKRDGECSSLYSDGLHARSLDGRGHPSRAWLARFHAQLAHWIPPGWRVCGENLYALHSIAYTNLPSYFQGFSVWDETNRALSWDDTEAFFAQIGIEPVPVLWRGLFDEKVLKTLAKHWDCEREEGFVVRLADGFAYEDFATSVAKWVRPNHVQTDEHWMERAVVSNGLAAGAAERIFPKGL